MALQCVDEMLEPPVVGKRYLVPHVFYPWIHHRNSKPKYWPIIGPKHEDAKHLAFEWQHYHVDGRFLTDREWQAAADYLATRPVPFQGAEATVAGVPLQRVDNFSADTVLPHPEPVYRVRQCRRVVPYRSLVESDRSGFLKLWRAFDGKPCSRVDGVLICPHKGAPLSSITPDVDGNITCPLHGLRFTRDGAPVAREEIA